MSASIPRFHRLRIDELVLLDIDQEVSDVVKTESSTIDSPTIQQRRIESSIAVNTGETIALGGLIKDHSENTVTGVPVLSNIPILGNLFKTTNNEHDRTELLVLLSPKVIKNTSEGLFITHTEFEPTHPARVDRSRSTPSRA